MKSRSRMSKGQRKLAFAFAVEASLESFYGQSTDVSHQLVRRWWHRLAGTNSFSSGLFLHAEPINTAARMLRVDTVEITVENEEIYQRILQKARERALTSEVEYVRAVPSIGAHELPAHAMKQSA